MRAWRIKSLSGYMTIEAASVFVTSLSLIILVVSVGIYKYEKCSFELECYYELQKSVQAGDSTQEYVYVDGRTGSVERQKNMTLFLGIFGWKDIALNFHVKYVRPNPVQVLRLKQRMMRLKEDEDRKDWSATVENGDDGRTE